MLSERPGEVGALFGSLMTEAGRKVAGMALTRAMIGVQMAAMETMNQLVGVEGGATPETELTEDMLGPRLPGMVQAAHHDREVIDME